MEFVALKTQLQEHMEKQVSRDQGSKSCDSFQEQTVTRNTDDSEGAQLSTNSSRAMMLSTASSTSSTMTDNSPTLSCSALPLPMHTPARHALHTPARHALHTPAPRQGLPQTVSSRCAIQCGSRKENSGTAEAPPPPTNHQPWPVTSILSQSSHCQHTTAGAPPTTHHGSSLTTDGVHSSPMAIQSTSAHLSPVSSLPAPATDSLLYHRPGGLTAIPNSTPMMSSSMSTQRNVITRQHQAGYDVTTHTRTDGGLVTTHSHHQQQQRGHSREHQQGGYLGLSPTSHNRYHPPPPIQPHISTIVQPWVGSQRPHPHHITKITPRSSLHHPLQHHQEHEQRNHSHTERFVPYPTTARGVNPHHAHSFSHSASRWHGHHMNTSSQNIAPLCRSYASAHDQHQHHSTAPLGNRNYVSSCDYPHGYLSTHAQGHPSPFCHVQNSTRNSNMMSEDSSATPPYPIQPHSHTGSNSTAAVWRPYSERSRSSGFCLSDILSLPSGETEPQPLQLEPTPPSGHRGLHSFLVNRLLDDI